MFDTYRLILIIIVTLIPFFWVFKLKDFNSKIYFGLFLLAFFIYSGIGGSLKDVDDNYFIYYVIYTIFISIGLYIGKGSNRLKGDNRISDNKLTKLIDKYGTTIILFFLILKLSTLIYPQFLLYRLIDPPAPDLSSVFAERFETQESTFLESIIYYLTSLLSPFFFLSLYKLRLKPGLIVSLLLLITYIDYCKIGYIGRGAMMQSLFVIIMSLYMFKPKLRIPIIIVVVTLIPTIIIFLMNYTQIRLGATPGTRNFFQAFEELIYSESSYPLWFSIIYNTPFDINNFFTFVEWLFALPIPGFLKGDIDLRGDELSGLLLGIDSRQPGFYIVLPGLVGESVYYFGKSFFWIHGLLVGMLVGYTFKLLNIHKEMIILFFYSITQLTYAINRGGTGSGFPYMLKILLVYFIILYIYSKFRIKHVR